MLAAVQLHDQPTVEAGKVDDEAAARHLTPELVTLKLPVAQAGPQPPLGRRLVAPEAAGGVLGHPPPPTPRWGAGTTTNPRPPWGGGGGQRVGGGQSRLVH